jgi:hypothetical protein
MDVEVGVFAQFQQLKALLQLESSGQSLLEFLLLLPFLLGLTILMIRANQAIQISIVNQQYARAQTHFITFNSPYYPDNRVGRRDEMIRNGVHAITLGVGEKSIGGDDEESSDIPEAPMQMVARSEQKAGPKPAAQEESERSGWVRIRNTITLCSGSLAFQSGGGFLDLKRIGEGVTPSSFAFCRESGL